MHTKQYFWNSFPQSFCHETSDIVCLLLSFSLAKMDRDRFEHSRVKWTNKPLTMKATMSRKQMPTTTAKGNKYRLALKGSLSSRIIVNLKDVQSLFVTSIRWLSVKAPYRHVTMYWQTPPPSGGRSNDNTYMTPWGCRPKTKRSRKGTFVFFLFFQFTSWNRTQRYLLPLPIIMLLYVHGIIVSDERRRDVHLVCHWEGKRTLAQQSDFIHVPQTGLF